VDDDITPMAEVPVRPRRPFEAPSPYTLEGEIAFFGNLAGGLRRRHPVVRYGVASFILAFFLVPVIVTVATIVSG
jgi:hypothetical protein